MSEAKIYPILTDEDPRLRQVAHEVMAPLPPELVEFTDPTVVTQLIVDMKATLKAAGGIGLAAPQIGVPLRIIVLCSDGDPDGLMMSFIDPVIDEQAGARYGKEGCLSVPGRTGRVLRASKVRVVGKTFYGSGKRSYSASALEAACIQHEIDHLDGILFIDKLED